MKKARSTWKPFDAVLDSKNSYHFDTELFTSIHESHLPEVLRRWGDILRVEEMTVEQVFDETAVKSVDLETNKEI